MNPAAHGLMHTRRHARDGEQSYGGSLCSRTVGYEEGRRTAGGLPGKEEGNKVGENQTNCVVS